MLTKKGTREMIYKAIHIRNWNTDCSIDGKSWIPARPETFWSFGRFKTAWLVLIGKLDALDWN